jgi:hypothetical protein
VSWTSSRTARDFSHHTVKISRRAVNLPTENKQFILGQFPHCENRRFLFMFCIYFIKFTTRREIFTVRREKYLAVRELIQDTYRARSEAANPVLFKFNIKNENFKILNPSPDG